MGNLNKAVMFGNSNSRFRRAENGILNGFVVEMYQCGLQLFLGHIGYSSWGSTDFSLAFFALNLFLQ